MPKEVTKEDILAWTNLVGGMLSLDRSTENDHIFEPVDADLREAFYITKEQGATVYTIGLAVRNFRQVESVISDETNREALLDLVEEYEAAIKGLEAA